MLSKEREHAAQENLIKVMQPQFFRDQRSQKDFLHKTFLNQCSRSYLACPKFSRRKCILSIPNSKKHSFLQNLSMKVFSERASIYESTRGTSTQWHDALNEQGADYTFKSFSLVARI